MTTAVIGNFRRAGAVRPFVERDIPQVARVHQAVFRPTARRDAAGIDPYRAYFTHVFLHSPCRGLARSSLVYEEGDGRITGFVGVVPRRMTLNGESVNAAVSSQFVVEPSPSAGVTAVRLAKAFLEGPQDISIADEANDASRRIWEGLGGATALLHSLHWTRPLRPGRYVLSLLRRRPALAAMAAAARPFAALADAVALRVPQSHFFSSAPAGTVEDAREATLVEHLPAMAPAGSLRFDTDEPTMKWLFERTRRRRAEGRLTSGVVRAGGRLLGWYVYHLGLDGVADVLQIAATPASVRDVLDHLFHAAAGHGALAAAGRLEPRFVQALSDKQCLFHRRGPWMLIHAARPELLHCFHDERASLSRLDGEWCLGF